MNKKFKQKIMVFFLAIILIFMFQISLKAKDKKLTPKPPIYGIPAKTLPKSKLIVRGYFIHPFFDKEYDKTKNSMIPIPSNTKLIANTFVLRIRYGITDRVTAILNLPLVSKSFTTPLFDKASTGIGDTVAALLFKAYHNKKNKFLTSVLAYSKFPTAKTDNLSSNEIPLGTGSYDYGFAILPEKEFGKWDLRWSGFYKFKGENYKNIPQGNEFTLSWSTAYNLSYRLIPEVSLIYNKIFSTEISPDFYYLKIGAGLEYRLKRKVLFQILALKDLSSKLPYSDSFSLWIGFFTLF